MQWCTGTDHSSHGQGEKTHLVRYSYFISEGVAALDSFHFHGTSHSIISYSRSRLGWSALCPPAYIRPVIMRYSCPKCSEMIHANCNHHTGIRMNKYRALFANVYTLYIALPAEPTLLLWPSD